MLIKILLQNPIIWDISQFIFGANKQKKSLYKSVIKNNGKMLDFGCADGNTFLAFKDHDYTGLDIDQKAIIHAAEKYKDFPNAKFICDDILKNNLPAKSYNSILFAGTAHHISDDLLFKIIRSLSRLLKKNGVLYFIDPVKSPEYDSFLLSFLISLDQGKFHRTASFYTKNLKNFSRDLKPTMHMIKHVNGNFMPQPKYYIAKLVKI
jgi:SAM-dependent methyltransferase